MDDNTYFDNAREMFMSAGWKNFVKEIETWLNAVSIDGCNSSDEFWMSKGVSNALRRVLAYERMVKQAELEAEEE